jgi:hypothetical protein
VLLATIDSERVDQVLNTLPAAMSNGLNDRLKAALAIPEADATAHRTGNCDDAHIC